MLAICAASSSLDTSGRITDRSVSVGFLRGSVGAGVGTLVTSGIEETACGKSGRLEGIRRM